jgi:Protein of unknown function (DUF1360)
MERTQPHESEANFSIEEYGAKTADKEECEEQLLAEYATLLGFYLASVAVVTGIAVQQNRLPRKFGLLDLALLGIATHKLSRIVAKDRITGILRAPFVNYIRGSGAGEVEEEPRGRGFQRGIGHLISCPYCMAPWCATALSFGFLLAPASDAVLRRDFGKRNRLGFSSPRSRSNETKVTLNQSRI